MKNNRFFSINTLSILTALAFALSLFSCDRENKDNTENLVIEEAEVVEVMEGALKTSSDGMAEDMEEAVYLAQEYEEKSGGNPCGESFDSTVVYNVANSYITAAYTSNWGWTVICNDFNVPSEIDFTRASAGTYETTRMLSDDSSNGNWNISNLILGDAYVFNGVYTRQGSQESKVNEQRAFSSLLSIEVDSINIDKGNQEILSGIASFTLTATGPEGATSTFEGDIVFNGGGSVTLIINGNSYNIDLF
ncbi:MAG TPA: hypothetical protein PKA00_18725 [Saprospiraceae bacterium]|nr:hypothetical protein [Saprospiraceae bacterium]HMQ84955.1 hypothetical protein [Saprospiraceae bacterium]